MIPGRWLFAVISLISYLHAENIHINDSISIHSPGYPKGYDYLDNTNLLYTLTVDTGFGMSFLFSRLALGPLDSLGICSDSNNNCHSINGSSNQSSLFFTAKQEVNIILYSGNKEKPYAGFQAEVRKIELNKSKDYFTCGSTVDLRNGLSPYFIVSQNYLTDNPTIKGNCFVKVMAPTYGIKIVVEDYVSGHAKTTAMLDGTNSAGNPVSQPISNGSKSIAYYFQDIVTFNFDAASTDYQYLMYAVKYDLNVVRTDCLQTGTFDVKNQSFIEVKSNKDDDGYKSNQLCDWKFTNLPPNSQFMVEVQADTESCCDVLTVDGIGEDGKLEYKGHTEYMFQFSTKSQIGFHFTSDAAEEYVGFRSTLNVLDCYCGDDLNRTLSIGDGGFELISPGYHGQQKTYCNDMQCKWTINYPRTAILRTTMETIDLYDGDSFIMLNALDNTKDKEEFGFDGNGKVSALFTSKFKRNYKNMKPNDLAIGFFYYIRTITTTNKFITIDLCTLETASFSSLEIPVIYHAVYYKFSIEGCDDRRIVLHHFLSKKIQTSYLLSIFDGDLETGAPLNIGLYDDLQRPILFINSKVATVKIVRLPDYLALDHPKELFGLAIASSANNANCGNNILVARTGTLFESLAMSGCTYIVYYDIDDFSDNVGINMLLFETSPANLTLYKGATVVENRRISGPSGEVPSFVYGSLFTISTPNDKATFAVSVTSYTQLNPYNISINGSGIVMTKDFGDVVSNVTQTNQTMLFYSESGRRAIVLEAINRLAGEETVEIQYILNNRTTNTKQYSSKDEPFKVEAKADSLRLTYSANEIYADGGLLVMYSLGAPFHVDSDGSSSRSSLL